MPKLSEFKNFTMEFRKNVIYTSTNNMRESSKHGAEYMRSFIKGNSHTGSPWHNMKNDINGYAPGSRIGGAVLEQVGFRTFEPSAHPGRMLGAVDSGKLSQSGQKLSINYGWLKQQQNYFILQDNGDYKATAGLKSRGVGMGLLNEKSGSGRSTLQHLGAFNSTNNFFIKAMVNSGFTISGGSNE